MKRSLAVIAAAALLLTGCAKKTPSATPTAATSINTATGSATPDPGATGTGKPTPKTSTTTAPPPTGPRIEYFRIKIKPSCPSSGPAQTFPGNPIVLEWKVVGGPTEVTISVDGPGFYGTYNAVYTETFSFGCDGPSNSTAKHTFLLKVPGYSGLQQTITGEAHIS